MSQFLLAHGARVVDLVSENKEGDLGKFLHGEEGVQLGLGLDKPLVVLRVDQEDNAADFGEVILPQTTGCKIVSTKSIKSSKSIIFTLLVTTEIKSRKPVVSNGKFLRCCTQIPSQLFIPPNDRTKREYILGCAVGCRIATRSFYRNILVSTPHASLQQKPNLQAEAKKKTHLQHMQQGRLSGIIKTEEQKLGMLVKETQRGQKIVD